MKMLLALWPLAFAGAEMVPLFDGRTLNGWEQCNGKAQYRVEDGAIVGRTVEGSPNSFLCTTRNYGDFLLEFEVKTDPLLNSGVQLRGHRYAAETEVTIENRGRRVVKQPAGRVYGYQVEVATAASGASGGIYDEARRGWVANIQQDPAASKAFRDNEWNKYRVEARGDRIRTWVNGVPCANLTDSLDLDGFIALQVHAYKGPAPVEVRWRNIRIDDLGRHRWSRIWDGRTFDGWEKQGGGSWTISGETLEGKQPGGGTEFGFLTSKASYSDFTLRLRYRIETGNSGVFFRMGDSAKERGFEVEVDPSRDPGGLQAPGTRGWLVHTGPMAEAWYAKATGWNQMTISAHGRDIVVHVNGVKASESLNDPGRLDGRIAFQLNPRYPLAVQFRDIEVLEPAGAGSER